jgi:TonB family protein
VTAGVEHLRVVGLARMKRPVFSLLLLAFVASYGQDSPEARAILDKAAQASQSGRSYRAEFGGSTEDKSTGFDRKLEFAGTILLQPPGKLRAEVRAGPIEQWTVRDGTQTWLYLPRAKQYRKFPSTTASTTNLGSLDPSSLFGVVMTGLQSARIVPDEDVTLEGSRIHCYVISARYEAGQAPGGVSPDVTLWIDQVNYVVLRRRVVVVTRNSQFPDSVETTLDMTVTKLAWAPALTGSEFVFIPPEGTTEMVSPRATGVSSGSPTPPTTPGVYRLGGGVSAPRVLSKKEPEYSEEARKGRLGGTSVLSLVVGEDGVPRNITVTKRLGLGLDEKAIEAVGEWRFLPGQKEGKPVAVVATIQVNFRLNSSPWYWRLDRAEYNLPVGASRPSLQRTEFPPFSPSQETGSVTLTLDVDEEGSPINIHAGKSSDAKWEEEVIPAVRKWRFEPGRKEGTPIAVPLTLEFSRVGPIAVPAPPPPPPAQAQ